MPLVFRMDRYGEITRSNRVVGIFLPWVGSSVCTVKIGEPACASGKVNLHFHLLKCIDFM